MKIIMKNFGNRGVTTFVETDGENFWIDLYSFHAFCKLIADIAQVDGKWFSLLWYTQEFVTNNFLVFCKLKQQNE